MSTENTLSLFPACSDEQILQSIYNYTTWLLNCMSVIQCSCRIILRQKTDTLLYSCAAQLHSALLCGDGVGGTGRGLCPSGAAPGWSHRMAGDIPDTHCRNWQQMYVN